MKAMFSGRRAAVLAAVASLSAVTGYAKAASVTALLNNVSPSQIVGVTYNGNYLGQAYAGSLNWSGQAGNDAGLTGNFSTFCIDLTQDVVVGGTYTYGVANLADAPDPTPPTSPIGVTGMGTLSAGRITNLYALEYDNVGTNNDMAAAFQIAMWELLFETQTPGDALTGTFHVSGASPTVITLADGFVSAAMSAGTLTFHNDLMALTSATAQDQVFLGAYHEPPPPPGNQTNPVPSPAAAFGALPLLAALAFFRRLRRPGTEI